MTESPDRSHREPERDARTGRSAAQARVQHQTQWVEQQIRIAQARGDFDNLPGAGKPIKGLGSEHDPDWWLKKLVEREHVTGVLPLALQVRKDDLELDAQLDRISVEAGVREAVEEFNATVHRAIYTPPVGNAPAFPVVTRKRDVETEVERWRERRRARREEQRAELEQDEADARARAAARRWWRRRH